jgi:hypothetical protein
MKIAIVMNDVLPGQKSFYAIKELEKTTKTVEDSPVIFFLNLSSPVVDVPFAMMNIYNITHFDGVCLATDLETADIVRKSDNRMERYFYVWDLEWLRKPHSFESVVGILRDPKLKLIARSEEHKQVIENYCNREVSGVVEDFNIDQIKELCNAY